MLFTPEQYRLLFAPGGADDRYRSQANAAYALGSRFGLWDFGVIPYELADFPAAERTQILQGMAIWERVAPIKFVPYTTQSGRLLITRDDATGDEPSPCFAFVGQPNRGVTRRLNLGFPCGTNRRNVTHEMGHSLGLQHEHQRADRDTYISVDLSNVAENARFNFTRYTVPVVGPYDFGSVMHYQSNAFALDVSRPVMVPTPPYASFAATMGRATEPSETDQNVMALLYNALHHQSDISRATESVRTRFDRADLLLAMERLHAFYMSRIGLQREQGLSINGRPDFLGIAQWIFDIYLPARSAGFSTEGAFDIVVAAITQTDEWRTKNPGRQPLTAASFRPVISFSRDEFLDVLNRLDRFYAAPEGLQRSNGLSIAGGPDFLGIATWIFDIYLNQRLTGGSANAAWVAVENAIRATDEWRSKH